MSDDVTRSGNVFFIRGAKPGAPDKPDNKTETHSVELPPKSYIDPHQAMAFLEELHDMPRLGHPLLVSEADNGADIIPFRHRGEHDETESFSLGMPRIVPVETPDFEVLAKFWAADHVTAQDEVSRRRLQTFSWEVAKLRAWLINTRVLIRDHLRLIIEHDLLHAPSVETEDGIGEAPNQTDHFSSPHETELLGRLEILANVVRDDIPKLKLHATSLASNIIPTLQRRHGAALGAHAATVYDGASDFLDESFGAKVRGHAVRAMANVIRALPEDRQSAARAETAEILKNVLHDVAVPKGLRMMLLKKHGDLLTEPLLVDLRAASGSTASTGGLRFSRSSSVTTTTAPTPPSMRAHTYLNIVSLGSQYDQPGAPHGRMRIHPDHFDWLVEQTRTRDPLANVLGAIVLGYIAGEKLAMGDPLIAAAAENLRDVMGRIANPDLADIEGSSADIIALDDMPPYTSDHSGRPVEVALGTIHEGLRGLHRTIIQTGQLDDTTVTRTYATMTRALIPYAQRAHRGLMERVDIDYELSQDTPNTSGELELPNCAVQPLAPMPQAPALGFFGSIMASLTSFFSGRTFRS